MRQEPLFVGRSRISANELFFSFFGRSKGDCVRRTIDHDSVGRFNEPVGDHDWLGIVIVEDFGVFPTHTALSP